MNARHLLRAVLLGVALGFAAEALAQAPAQAPAPAPAPAQAPTRAPAPARASAPAKAKPSGSTAAAQQAGRLEDIRIEGEIPAPQVLFVTARDQRRLLDSQHRRYLKTAVLLGRETLLPTRIALVGFGPTGERKETAP